MRWKMLFRLGLTLVVFAAVLLFYLNNILHKNYDKEQLVGSPYEDFHDALENHGHEDSIRVAEAHDVEKIKAEGHAQVPDKTLDPNRNEKLLVGGPADRDKANSYLRVAEEDKWPAEMKPVDEDDAVHSELLYVHRRLGQRISSISHGQIHLAIVACDDRAEEVMVLLKSAVVMTPTIPLVFHIFAERELHSFFTQQLDIWTPEVLEGVDYRIYDITFPEGENAEDWKKLFKPCASQRLFLPTLLRDVDSLIYVDTDILFVSPLSKIWSFFSQFNATQLVALAPEHEDSSTGWYNRFARHPYVPPLGVNSGVMLMNLTRLRQSKWLLSMIDYYKEYRLKITWGDQDLINIYFHFFPEQLYLYPCDWNYRPDHCMYMSVCKPAEQHGAFVLHGCRRVMHNEKQPAFKAVYTTFKEYHFGEDLEFTFLPRLKRNLKATKDTPCGKLADIFYKQIEEFIAERHRIQETFNKNAEALTRR